MTLSRSSLSKWVVRLEEFVNATRITIKLSWSVPSLVIIDDFTYCILGRDRIQACINKQ